MNVSFSLRYPVWQWGLYCWEEAGSISALSACLSLYPSLFFLLYLT